MKRERRFNLDDPRDRTDAFAAALTTCGDRVTVAVDWDMDGNTMRFGEDGTVYTSFDAWCRLQENKQRGLKPLPEGTVN